MNFDKLKRDVKRTFRKKSVREKKLELLVQYGLMDDELDAAITLDLARVQQLAESKLRDERTEARIKNAYYTRLLIDQARADLTNLDSDTQVNKLINQTAKALHKLNRMAQYSPRIGHTFFDWQAQELNARMTEKPELVKMPELDGSCDLPDTILSRLLNGERIEDCIHRDRTIIECSGVSDEDAPAVPNLNTDDAQTASVDTDYAAIIARMRKDLHN